MAGIVKEIGSVVKPGATEKSPPRTAVGVAYTLSVGKSKTPFLFKSINIVRPEE